MPGGLDVLNTKDDRKGHDAAGENMWTMPVNIKNIVSQIIRLRRDNSFPDHIENEIRSWLIHESHREEKESAMKEAWNGIDASADKGTEAAYRKIARKLNITADVRTSKKRKNAVLALSLSLAAAAVVAVMVLLPFRAETVTEPVMVTVSAPYNELRHIELPDGSEALLRGGGSVTYEETFASGRNVAMSGEAYFKVRPGSDPFVVETHGPSVKVLGTEFSVESYPAAEEIAVILDKGKVEVSDGGSNRVVLAPGQRLAYDTGSKSIHVGAAPSYRHYDWETGELRFEFARLEELFAQISRQYGVTIIHGYFPESARCTVKFMNTQTLEQVLTIVRDLTKAFTYEIIEDKVHIKQ